MVALRHFSARVDKPEHKGTFKDLGQGPRDSQNNRTEGIKIVDVLCPP